MWHSGQTARHARWRLLAANLISGFRPEVAEHLVEAVGAALGKAIGDMGFAVGRELLRQVGAHFLVQARQLALEVARRVPVM